MRLSLNLPPDINPQNMFEGLHDVWGVIVSSTKMGADAPIPTDTITPPPPKGRPRGGSVAGIPFNRPAQRGPAEAAERPPQGVGSLIFFK